MRLRIVILSLALATALWAGLPTIGRSESFDSGIFGVVPGHAQGVETEQEYVDLLRNELATRPDQDPNELRRLNELRGVIDQREEQLAEMKDRCVQAFDPKSDLPAAYLGGGMGPTGVGSCFDNTRFPQGFMKVLATAPCNQDGSFRLALAPGRYAVFFGERYGRSWLWWQYVDVAPHQWLHMVEPKENGPIPCKTDVDCLKAGLKCIEIGRGQGSVHECLRGMRNQPATYDSGVRGRIGAPNAQCGRGTRRAEPEVPENQCIEAFREGSAYMAACAGCQIGDGAFVLPLPPGRYVLQIGQEYRALEVVTGQWSELYAQGAEPGPVRFPTCPTVQ